MNRQKYILGICFILSFLFQVGDAHSQRMRLRGNWSLTIDASDLAGGTGTDIVSTYYSNADEIMASVIRTSTTWDVYVQGEVTNWHNDMRVSIRRTGDGNGTGWISGGTSWLQITLGSQLFYSGSNRRRNVPVQLRLAGVSLQVPADTHSGTITYTVVEN